MTQQAKERSMKTEEDEAFDELARRQGMWGGGFPAKRAMAADKLLEDATRSCNNIDEQRALDALMREAQSVQEPLHIVQSNGKHSPLLTHMMNKRTALAQPAQEHYDQTALELCGVCGWKTLIPDDGCLNCERKEKPIQQEAIYGMNQDDWKDVVAAIAKVRDGRGIYLACRPADVFQEWFLALGTAKVKEKNG